MESGVNDLESLWRLQAQQQQFLGLDPDDLSDVERRDLADDLVLHLHEEATELGRLSAGYKRHILRAPRPNTTAVAEECADVLKTLLALAQLHGVSLVELVHAFTSKTVLVQRRAMEERLKLENNTRVLVSDLDDVLCDLQPWRDELGIVDDRDVTAVLRLEASENMKNQFYAGGRFREMDAIPGAADALRAAKAAGLKIVIITARPQWQYKRLHADTVFWLDKHKIPCDLLIFDRNKVEALYKHVAPAWPVAFVEDHPDNAGALARVGVNVLLFDQPHNRGLTIPGTTRVVDWEQVASIVGFSQPTQQQVAGA
jgi:NTP pyrophosphatase (non-canonical NTP hydrolase)